MQNPPLLVRLASGAKLAGAAIQTGRATVTTAGLWLGATFLGAVLGPALVLGGAPARALEVVYVAIPLLDTKLKIRLDEISDPQSLINGNSDLAELVRASDGVVGGSHGGIGGANRGARVGNGNSIAARIIELFNTPVPLSLTQIANGSVGSPLLEQAMLVLSSFGTIEGRPADLSGRTLNQSLLRAASNGEPTLLSLMRAIPGRAINLDLGRARRIGQLMLAQRRRAEQLMASLPAASLPPAAMPATLAAPAAQRSTLALAVAHRPQPLELLLLTPAGGRGNGHLVVISHGLWDEPASFEGWGLLLARHGYTVVLPRHPGSDSRQQQAVLSGESPPPGPGELARRPKDIRALLDAIAANRIAPIAAAQAQRVVVLGHSWGATTALQLAGLKPSTGRLLDRCNNVEDPDRNLSWTLQCSWLRGVDQAALGDRRVVAVAAVSPPNSLLFDRGAALAMGARVLLISGSRDWVVPPDPEAINAIQRPIRLGHRLVLAQGGDHFNLRPGTDPQGGVLGALLLAWTDGAFAAGAAVRPGAQAASLLRPGGWGNTQIPLRDVTDALLGR
jgi:predicted dienelactone hydrolase